MGKRHSEQKDRERDTRVIFKKSNNTIYTQSRTFSGASQFYTKSGLLQIKKNFAQTHEYYVKGDKVKRDLSIETDVCILRQYYKRKRNKLSFEDGSAKSKYSTVIDTETDNMIEEYKPDTSACGDSEHTESVNNNNVQLDLASIMMENFKGLLNNWIQKYILDNNEAKQKLNTVLDSILHRLELDSPNVSSSRSTYILNKDESVREVKNKKIATPSIICQYCKKRSHLSSTHIHCKQQCRSVPFSSNNLTNISTLSIPRHVAKHQTINESRNKSHKVKKIRRKNRVLSINKSSNLDVSSIHLIELSTKSLTKRCATYIYNSNDVGRCQTRRRHIVFFPEPLYQSATNTTTVEHKRETNPENCKNYAAINVEIPSLVKSIYANNRTRDASTIRHVNCGKSDSLDAKNKDMDTEVKSSATSNIRFDVSKNIYRQKRVLNGRDQSDHIITIDFFSQTNNSRRTLKVKNKNKKSKFYVESQGNNNNKLNTNNSRVNKKRRQRIQQKVNKYKKIDNKHFTFLYKKAYHQMLQYKEFLQHFHKIFEHLANYNVNNDMKLDIQINVVPENKNKTKDNFTDASNHAPGFYEPKKDPTTVYNLQPILDTPTGIKESANNSSECGPDIIPLLDGAVSQTKYIFRGDSTTGKFIESNSLSNKRISCSIETSDLDIVQEINELKSIIKDLAVAAEAFVQEHQKIEYEKSKPIDSYNKNTADVTSESINKRVSSKGIQIFSNFTKSPFLSGLRLTKEPRKKDLYEFYNRLMKKSTSYNVIESESILKITDMTSAANEINKQRQVDKSLTCSLPKSNSLFEITTEKYKRKLITYFCNDCRPDDYVYNAFSSTTPTCHTNTRETEQSSKQEKIGKDKIYRSPLHPKYYYECSPRPSTNSNCNDCCKRTSTVIDCADVVDEEKGFSKNIGVKGERVEFGKGCFYCVLLLISVLIIACLFCIYVLRDQLKLKIPAYDKSTQNSTFTPKEDIKNLSRLIAKISDLGF